MKKISLLALFFSILFIFVSCGSGDNGGSGGNPGAGPTAPVNPPSSGETKTYKVMVSYDPDNVTVVGANPIEVKEGENAVFDIQISSTARFVSTSVGTYDSETGKLTVTNVTSPLNIAFVTENLGYDTTKTFKYIFDGADHDTSDPKSSIAINYGTLIKLKAKDTDRVFVGWSFGKKYERGGEIVSTERNYSFVASPDLADNDVLYVYANYSDANVYYYDPNGGSINTFSENIRRTTYYGTNVVNGKLKVTLKNTYYDYAKSAATFYDDGSFTKDGYVLVGYNTKPDGSGDGYSLGSKFYTMSEGAMATLYCMWEPVSSDFEYQSYDYLRPADIKQSNSPEWNEHGVIITRYNGNDSTVVIPEMIGGKPVIAIAEGAFVSKDMNTLVLSRHLLKIEDGAFVGCPSLRTVYFADGIHSMTDAAFDAATLKGIKKLYVNAVIAPRYSNTSDGAFAVKLSRLLAAENEKRIIVISGSSSYLGLSTPYLESLLDMNYTVINLGTTRTTHGTVYLEAMSVLADEDDIVVYAPENSAYMLGETEMYWKTLRDLEGMNNFFRYIDISGYNGVFSAFSDFNANYRYKRAPRVYEDICTLTSADEYGDRQVAAMGGYNNPDNYSDYYLITFNNRCKSKLEFANGGSWKDEVTVNEKDYMNPENLLWCSYDTDEMVALMNQAVNGARSSGARVLFGFAPTDASSVADASRSREALENYENMILEMYDFDGLLGSAADYVFAHEYFYDCAFHTNDYGRVYRTYMLYIDIAEIEGITELYDPTDKGTDFEGCLFERISDLPRYKVDYLMEE